MQEALQQNTQEDEIDLAELFGVLRRYQYSIILISILVTLFATIFAYFATNIYQAKATIEVKSERNAQKDFMSMALGMDSNNVDNEIEILKSRWIISRAQEQLNLNTRYFTKHNLKSLELYKKAPFVVTSGSISKQVQSPFILTPINETQFRLSLEPSFKKSAITKLRSFIAPVPKEDIAIAYDQIHTYGKTIVTPWFRLVIQKVFQPTKSQYTFTIADDKSIYESISANLSVSTLSKMGTILSITFEDNNPQRATEIVNAITNAYLSADLDVKTQSANRTLEFLDRQLEAINKTLQNSADNLQKYKATNIVIDVGDKAQLTSERLGELESQRYEIDMQLDVLNNTLNYVTTNSDLSAIDLSSTGSMNPTINTLVLKIQESKALKNALLVDYTELHPDVLKANEQLNSLRNTLKNTLTSSLRTLKERKISLSKFIDENTASLESLPQQERELAQLNRSFLVNEKIYSFLLQKRAETAIVESSTVSETRVIDSAIQADKPIKPKRMLIVIVGFILGLIISIALAFLRNFLDDTIKTIEDIEKHSLVSVYGAVPHLESEKNIQPFYEALRVIRTNLEFLQEHEGKSKLITITSSVPTEGKTTVMTEL
ncbi:MAG: GNVR domain-containing protein, partial [Campylobacterota bacterium]|nr:GNVR domain-containing protein [Campylobacterota bacterium]